MKILFTLFFLWAGSSAILAQQLAKNHVKKVNFNGQWKGGFNETSLTYPGDYNTVYVLELQTNGSHVSGYSYTYFTEFDKKYYTICRLTGTLNRTTNDLIVTEIERTKYNTPPEFRNCFQTHKLHYEKQEDGTEVLRGTWYPAPNQTGNCGSGITVLSRRVVNRMPYGLKPKSNDNVAKSTPKKVVPKKTTPVPPKKKPEENNSVTVKPKPIPEKTVVIPKEKTTQALPTPEKIIPKNKFENRRTDIVKTIELESPEFKLDFYDNGEIDGDSISVFYNGKLVLANKRLSEKPITLYLKLDPNIKENIVTMYADNLGSIPPNTSVMIVTAGTKRYEVRITSDTVKSGSVIFSHQ